MPACALAPCRRPTTDGAFTGTHWLCRAHRKERGALVAAARVVTETELLVALVFSFPPRCAKQEFKARFLYAAEVWNAHDKAHAVLRAHSMRGKVRVTKGVPRADLLRMTTGLVAFVCAHVDAFRARLTLGAACAERVRQWYPILTHGLTERAPMLRAERMLHLLHAATGTRDFLVLADFVCALPLPPELCERVYAAYLATLSSGATLVRWGAEYCT